MAVPSARDGEQTRSELLALAKCNKKSITNLGYSEIVESIRYALTSETKCSSWDLEYRISNICDPTRVTKTWNPTSRLDPERPLMALECGKQDVQCPVVAEAQYGHMYWRELAQAAP